IDERENLGIFNKDDASNARLERNQEIQSLIDALKTNNLLDENHLNTAFNDEIVIAIHKYIAISNAKIAIIQIEDLACEATSVNLPGTDKERPNWQRKISKNIDQIFGDKNNLSTKIANAVKLTNR
ncbi:MAG: 4-alpha-glucanotransferase, partial [Caulobacterales bacterium]|nr:4-alpha-glucanotransferase [Caulobacterales bacterium]